MCKKNFYFGHVKNDFRHAHLKILKIDFEAGIESGLVQKIFPTSNNISGAMCKKKTNFGLQKDDLQHLGQFKHGGQMPFLESDPEGRDRVRGGSEYFSPPPKRFLEPCVRNILILNF